MDCVGYKTITSQTQHLYFTLKRSFPRRFNLEYTWCVCRKQWRCQKKRKISGWWCSIFSGLNNRPVNVSLQVVTVNKKLKVSGKISLKNRMRLANLSIDLYILQLNISWVVYLFMTVNFNALNRDIGLISQITVSTWLPTRQTFTSSKSVAWSG